MMRAWRHSKDGTAQTVAVDHDVERQKECASTVGQHFQHAFRGSQYLRAGGLDQGQILHIAKSDGEWLGELVTAKEGGRALAQHRLLLDQPQYLRQQRRNGKRQQRHQPDQHACKDNRDASIATHLSAFEPLHRGVQGTNHHQCCDQDKNDRNQPLEHPDRSDNHDRAKHRERRDFDTQRSCARGWLHIKALRADTELLRLNEFHCSPRVGLLVWNYQTASPPPRAAYYLCQPSSKCMF